MGLPGDVAASLPGDMASQAGRGVAGRSARVRGASRRRQFTRCA